MDLDKVKEFLKKQGRRTKSRLRGRMTCQGVSAISLGDIWGYPVHVDPILEVVRNYGLVLAGDVEEGLGAKYIGQRSFYKVAEEPSRAALSIPCFPRGFNQIGFDDALWCY